MEEGKGERYLASGRQYGNALLGVRHQEEDILIYLYLKFHKILLFIMKVIHKKLRGSANYGPPCIWTWSHYCRHSMSSRITSPVCSYDDVYDMTIMK